MQVHEKQILSPLLMFCLSVAMGDFVKLYEIVNSVCLTSMFMLIRGDSADFEALYLNVLTWVVSFKIAPWYLLPWLTAVHYCTLS